MVHIPEVNINDFDYDLPQERIAQYPLHQRDQSKLLVYREGRIEENIFAAIPDYLPKDSLLVYNQTRVIQARLIFRKDTGASIEIFCLEPVQPTREVQQAFSQGSGVVWKCMVGNSKRWKDGVLNKQFRFSQQNGNLHARRISRAEDHSLIEFTWEPAGLTFSEVLRLTGTMPLPPYMQRKADAADKERYQTVYARAEGSVAAPTAGLHFTDKVLRQLKEKNISTADVTLHVGAGTFKPVHAEQIRDHEMHTEKIVITKKTIESILNHSDQSVIATGTTTMRTLESLYWHGVKIMEGITDQAEIDIHQWDPYKSYSREVSVKESLEAVLGQMHKKELSMVSGETRLMIVPGYRFRLADLLITNFHMPQSTLLMLVSAFIGKDWATVYRYAMDHNFRFLSYGDACLFFGSMMSC